MLKGEGMSDEVLPGFVPSSEELRDSVMRC